MPYTAPMLAPPSSSLEASFEGLTVAGVFLVLGYLLADALIGRRSWSVITRIGLALPGFMTLTLVLMLAHIASGGRVLSNGWLTRSLVAIVFIALIALKIVRKRKQHSIIRSPGKETYLALGVAVLLAVGLWGFPTTRLLPLDHGWDTDRDTGLASQIVAGQRLPTATVTGDVPNDYPWMHHASLALLASFTLGGRAMHAMTPMFFLQVVGGVLALFALGWELTARWFGGFIAALFGGLSGGFGYLVRNGPPLVLNPRGHDSLSALRRLGDMLFVRTYNMSFANLAPTFPRDVGFALLAAFLLLVVVGFRLRSLAALVSAGFVIGLIGCTTGESVLFGLTAALFISIAPPRVRNEPDREHASVRPEWDEPRPFRRLQVAAALLLPALAVWSLWLGPIAYNYVRYDGFADSVNTLVRLNAVSFLGSWGVAALFAVYGLISWLVRSDREPEVKIIFMSLVAASALLLWAKAIPLQSSTGFKTFGREHRYWPLVYLPVGIFGALGASRFLSRLFSRRWKGAALVGLGLIVALSVPSPLLASLALPRVKHDPRAVERSLVGGRTMLNLMAPRPGMRCIAAVEPDWTHAVFAYTGYRLVLFRWTGRVGGNAAHIRWRGIYDHIPGTQERLHALHILLSPRNQRKWETEAKKWGVNVVAVPRRRVPAWMRNDYRVEKARFERRSVSVVWRKPCG